MAIKGLQLTVAATATVVNDTRLERHGNSILIQNPSGGQTVYLGGENVTSTVFGYALPAGAQVSLDMEEDEILYGVVASGTQTVNILKQGVQP